MGYWTTVLKEATSIMEASDTFIDGDTAYKLARNRVDFSLTGLEDSVSFASDDIENRGQAVEQQV